MLLPFHQVFIQSDALRLVIAHYVKSPPDGTPPPRGDHGSAEPSSASSPSSAESTRGGVSLMDLEMLMDVCLVADKPLRDDLLRQVQLLM